MAATRGVRVSVLEETVRVICRDHTTRLETATRPDLVRDFFLRLDTFFESVGATSANALGPAAPPAVEQTPFTNEDVITMVGAGFSKETVVAAIQTHGPDFDTFLQALVALRDAGVDEDIIVAILAAARAAADRAAEVRSGGDSDLPSGDGVYAVVDGTYVPLPPDVIEWRVPFWAGRKTVNGVTTTRLNARVPIVHSAFEMSAPPEMVMVCDRCSSALDYHLVRAHNDDDTREFRVSFQATQGASVLLGGTGDERMLFSGEQIAPGKFRLELPDLDPGDYGFLPPGQSPVTYTFRVVKQ